MASPAGIYLETKTFVSFCLGTTRTTRTPRATRAKGDLPYFTHCTLKMEVLGGEGMCGGGLIDVGTQVHRAFLYKILNRNFTEYGIFCALLPSLLKRRFQSRCFVQFPHIDAQLRTRKINEY